jgi:hypothetical protein
MIVPLPSELSWLALANRKLVFEMLFANVSATIKDVARTQCGLAEIGYLAVLHTWGQQLQHHVHLHLIIAGGGLTDTGQWKTLSEKFFLPVKVLRTVFRAKMLQALLEAYEAGKIKPLKGVLPSDDRKTFHQFYGKLLTKEWVVHVKPPVHGNPDIVLKYLARYVYRIGISDNRLLTLEGDQVTFAYKDYTQEGHPTKQRRVSAAQLLDLFLQHVSPRGFKRVRYVGFWAGSAASQRIAAIRQQITGDPPATQHSIPQDTTPCASNSPSGAPSKPPLQNVEAAAAPSCPHCGSTDLQLTDVRERHHCTWMWSLHWDIFPPWLSKCRDAP